MSDPEVLLPTNKLFFFPFMAAGLTCSMMLHIPILTFIFHQSFLPYYIKKQLRAKMWPQTPLSDFFLTTLQCWLDWHAILCKASQLTHLLFEETAVIPGPDMCDFCSILQHWSCQVFCLSERAEQ